MMRDKHFSHHKKKDLSERICVLCNGKTRKDRNGYEDWRIDIDGYLCFDCYINIRYYRKKFGFE